MSHRYTVDRLMDVWEVLGQLIPRLENLIDWEGLDGEPERQLEDALPNILSLRELCIEQANVLDALDAEAEGAMR